MKDMVPGNELTSAVHQDSPRKPGRRKTTRCSICMSSIWFSAIDLMEPPGAPEPRRVWTLCKSCHGALLTEMRRSPIRSPLRLRIAMGLVAAERSPRAYNLSTHVRDQARIVGIAWVFIIAMLLHLALIVMLAFIAGR